MGNTGYFPYDMGYISYEFYDCLKLQPHLFQMGIFITKLFPSNFLLRALK